MKPTALSSCSFFTMRASSAFGIPVTATRTLYKPPAVGPLAIDSLLVSRNLVTSSAEACGANLCGYSVKTNEKILISMKPTGAKWTGQIHDPDSGSNYDSTIAMKGANALRVQGCAFGGMFCGGQTWKRVS